MQSAPTEKNVITLEDITNKTVRGYDTLAQARKRNRTNPRRHVVIEIQAEFEQMDAECCTIQQYRSINGKSFEEDEDPNGTTYGPRSTPTKRSEREAMRDDAYLYYSVSSQGDVIPDNERGEYYRSNDYPATSSTYTREKWLFKVMVIYTCNKNKEVTSIFYTIDWS